MDTYAQPARSEMQQTGDPPRPVDLAQIPNVPWAYVSEHIYGAIRGCSVKVLQRERGSNTRLPFRRINGDYRPVQDRRYYRLSGIAAPRRMAP